jgi:hypothetical protein
LQPRAPTICEISLRHLRSVIQFNLISLRR